MGMVMKVTVVVAVIGVYAYGTWALAIKEEKLPQDEEEEEKLPQDEDEEEKLPQDEEDEVDLPQDEDEVDLPQDEEDEVDLPQDEVDLPQDCVYEEGELGECDAACGETGVRRGEVVVVREADVGGEPCPTEVTEACTGPPCQPCVTSNWVIGECLGPSGESCHPLTGQKGGRRNTRTVLNNPDGQPCGELEEMQECDLRQCVPCVYEEEWVPVGGCDPVGDGPDCGTTGKQLQKRDVADYGDDDETSCPQMTQEIDCELRDCVPCLYEEDWVSVGVCEPVGDGPDCGTGKQLQKRDVVDYGDGDETSCLQLTQEFDCALRDCEPCDVQYTPSGCVGADGRDCGDGEGTFGQTTYSRTVLSNPDDQPCAEEPDGEPCELPACPVGCELEWETEWGPCIVSNSTTGEGVREMREVIVRQYPGVECPAPRVATMPCVGECKYEPEVTGYCINTTMQTCSQWANSPGTRIVYKKPDPSTPWCDYMVDSQSCTLPICKGDNIDACVAGWRVPTRRIDVGGCSPTYSTSPLCSTRDPDGTLLPKGRTIQILQKETADGWETMPLCLTSVAGCDLPECEPCMTPIYSPLSSCTVGKYTGCVTEEATSGNTTGKKSETLLGFVNPDDQTCPSTYPSERSVSSCTLPFCPVYGE